MQRRATTENGSRAVAWIVVQERPAAAQLVLEVRQAGARALLPFVVAPSHAEREAVARRHDDAGGPDLDVERHRLSRLERLAFVVRVIRAPRLAELLVELAMRCTQPSLRDRRMRVYRAHESDFA